MQRGAFNEFEGGSNSSPSKVPISERGKSERTVLVSGDIIGSEWASVKGPRNK